MDIDNFDITTTDIIQTKAEAFEQGIFWPLKLTPKQQEAIQYLTDDTTDFLMYGGAAGGGKTWLGCEWLLWMSLAYPMTRWFIGRKELKKLRLTTLVTLLKVIKKHSIPSSWYSINGKDNFLKFKNGSQIDFLDLKLNPSDPFFEDMGSSEYTGGFIEEGGEVPFEAFDTLKTRIGRHLNQKDENGNAREKPIRAKILITANPKKNWLYSKIYKPYSKGKLPSNYAYVQALVQDNLMIDAGYIENLKAISSASKKERLLFGNWEYEDDPNRLITHEAIEDIFTNTFVRIGSKAISADIAFQGSDLFVLGTWSGQRCERIVIIKKADADEIEKAIRFVSLKDGVRRSQIVFDADGIGSFLSGYLKGAKPFNAGGKVVKRKGEDNYLNLSAQVSFLTAKRIQDGEMYINPNEFYIFAEGKLKKIDGIPYVERIKEELAQIKEKETDEQKKRLIPKSEVKQRLGYSPDFWDMLKMRELLNLKGRLAMA